MIELPQCEMVGVFGPVASGKTHLIKQWLKTENRFVVFDYSGEMLDNETVIGNPKRVLTRVKENPYFFRLSYVPSFNVENDFAWILWSLWFAPVHKLLVCDEVHRIIPLMGMCKEAETMCRFARHAHLGFIGASQRLQDVSKVFTDFCRTIVLFQTNEATSLDAIDKRWKCAETVRNLRPLLYDDRNKVVKQTPQAVVCKKGYAPEVVNI